MPANHLDLTPSPRLLEVLGDIPFQPWQCIAELIDNSFDAFDSEPRPELFGLEKPTVWIEVPKSNSADASDAKVRIADNGPGMTAGELENSLRAGYSGNARYGSLGLFGMGFNIATARLGRSVEVRTSRAGESDWTVVTINFRDLQRRQSFQAPVVYERKDDTDIRGTEIVVSELSAETRQALRRANLVSNLRTQLGKVYSYLLRTKPIPGISNSEADGQGYSLKVNSVLVRPRVPCVWSESRAVTVSGDEVPAVIPIDHALATAFACQSCGTWHSFNLDVCEDCGSEDIRPRTRRVHGWLGVQRYLDGAEYGIDFIRSGRKILLNDKRVFWWDDPNGLANLIEYPIEVPANRGRIVGEIHLDHVGVTYQKNDFQRETRDWVDAIRLLRGEGPIQPKKAREFGYDPNMSPISRLFAAFRRNDAGVRYLTPGDGSNALHERSRQWGQSFHKGEERYQSDDVWFDAAVEHDRIKSGLRTTTASPDESHLRNRLGLEEPNSGNDQALLKPLKAPLITGGKGDVSSPASSGEPATAETEHERFERLRREGIKIPGLEGQVSLGRQARKHVSSYMVNAPLLDKEGARLPSLINTVRGGDVEVFVDPGNIVFTEYGRDIREFAIMEIAAALNTLSGTSMAFTAATAEVIQQFPDQKFTDGAVRERCENILEDVRGALSRLASSPSTNGAAATDLWDILSSRSKDSCESRAAAVQADLDWAATIERGGFIEYLDALALGEVVRERPTIVFDGRVFRTRYSSWSSSDTRTRVSERVARLLDTVGEYLGDPTTRAGSELKLVQVTLDQLSADVVESGFS